MRYQAGYAPTLKTLIVTFLGRLGPEDRLLLVGDVRQAGRSEAPRCRRIRWLP